MVELYLLQFQLNSLSLLGTELHIFVLVALTYEHLENYSGRGIFTWKSTK